MVYIYEYLINPTNLSGAFTMLDSNFIGYGVGSMAAITIADINNDGKLEYLLGNGRGGLVMYSDSMWDQGTTLGTIEIPASSNQVHVYPNPAKEYFVCTPENAEFINPKTEIYNVLGQNMRAEITFANNKITVSTAMLSSGFYVVRITDEGKTYVG